MKLLCPCHRSFALSESPNQVGAPNKLDRFGMILVTNVWYLRMILDWVYHIIWNMVRLLDVTTSAQIDHKIVIKFLMALGVANAWKLLAQWLFEVCGLSTTTVCLQDAMVGWAFCETCNVPFRRSLGKCMILPLVISPNHFWRSHSCQSTWRIMQVTPNEVGDSIYEFMNGFAVMWLLTSYYITGLLRAPNIRGVVG